MTMERIIPYGRQSIDDSDVAAVKAVLESDWLTQGPHVTNFEKAICRLTGAKHCVAVCNGTMALYLACAAVGLTRDHTGITSPISFMASANCIAYCGARPDFVDIDAARLCLDPDGLERYCRRNAPPRVVIPVDFAGVPADLPSLRRLSQDYGFLLIEDAAHAIGSVYRSAGIDYQCGSCAHSDLAIFSFHPVKNITTGEGGAVLTNDDGLADRVRRLANHGIERNPSRFCNLSDSGGQPWAPWYHEMQELAVNARLTDFQSALGLSQLNRLELFKSKRQSLFNGYNAALMELAEDGYVVLPPWPRDTDPCFHLYALRLGPRAGISREHLYQGLRQRGIYTQVHYIPIYRQPYYADQWGWEHHRYPQSEAYFQNCLSLPLFADLTEQEAQVVAKAVKDVICGA